VRRDIGSLGFVAINNGDTAWSATFATGLPAGSYCNVIEGRSIQGICSGTAYVATSYMYALITGFLQIPGRGWQQLECHHCSTTSDRCTYRCDGHWDASPDDGTAGVGRIL
jgi:hypothetical protein